jgi:4-hydroxy-4-methyl-2-oxoglutarate aldolase
MTSVALDDYFEGYATATIYEAAGKLGDMDPSIRPFVPNARMSGTAFTVKCFVGDSRAVIRAIDAASPGDVLVIDIGGTPRATAWGGSSAAAAKRRGLRGVVTNGSVRDLDELVEIGLPVFAAGVSVRGTVKGHPGWHGMPVSVGGVAVHRGDLVIGDSDGVVVVPFERADEVLSKTKAQHDRESEMARRIAAGESMADILGLA